MFPRPEQISLHVYGLIKFLAEYSFLHTRFSKLTESEVQGGFSTIAAVLTFIHIFLFHPVQFSSIQSLIDFSFLIVLPVRKQINHHKCGERSGLLTQRLVEGASWPPIFKWWVAQKWKFCFVTYSALWLSNPILLFSILWNTKGDIQ